MLKDLHPENLFIFDIETVPGKKNHEELSEPLQQLWEDKVGRFRKEDDDKSAYYFSKAGIFAEFGKVIVISCGYLIKQDGAYRLRVKTFSDHDEKKLLRDFSDLLHKLTQQNPRYQLCGHNIKEFDVPWLCRRMLINGIELPDFLDLYGKKPWETNFVDTLELWKFGDFKNYTSLNLLAAILDVPSPKDDIDGSKVGAVYWQENDLARIAKYCSKDVVAVAQVIMRLKGMDLLREDEISFH